MQRSDLIYGVDINFENVGFTDDEYDEGISWSDERLEKIRAFANAYDFVILISTYNDNITDLVVGIPLYSVRDIGESNMYAIEKAKNLFEEKTQNGSLEELMKTMGRTLEDEPDLHMMMEE